MKTTLTFEFDDEDGESDFEEKVSDFVKAKNWQLVVWELDQYLRTLYKHGDEEKIDIYELREKVWEIMEENEVKFNLN